VSSLGKYFLGGAWRGKECFSVSNINYERGAKSSDALVHKGDRGSLIEGEKEVPKVPHAKVFAEKRKLDISA